MATMAVNTRPLTGAAPVFELPVGATDCHVHLYLPNHALQPYGPTITEQATVADYRQYQAWLGLDRVVLTQPNGYQMDNAALLEGLQALGPEIARGVAVVMPDTPDSDLAAWHEQGVRGARIMNLLNGAVQIDAMLAVEQRIRAFGWHLMVQFNGRKIDDYLAQLRQVEGDYIIDHIGKFMPPVDAQDRRVDEILRLLDRGNAWFKICAAYEASEQGGPEWPDVGPIAQRVINHAPERVIWGSNWPHVGVPREQYPDDVAQLDVLQNWATAEQRQRLLVDNPARLYGF